MYVKSLVETLIFQRKLTFWKLGTYLRKRRMTVFRTKMVYICLSGNLAHWKCIFLQVLLELNLQTLMVILLILDFLDKLKQHK